MRKLFCVLPALFAAASFLAPAARADSDSTTLNFAVTRNGDRIGTSTIRLMRNGPQTVAEIATQVQVKIAYVTVYRFEQHETEHWQNGKVLMLTANTDDNGTVHKVSARWNADALAVEADGKTRELDPKVVPFTLWTAPAVRQALALNPQDGSLTHLSVVDRGEDQLIVRGRPVKTRHFSLKTSFPQDVWYDENDRLVKVELHGSDGSTIQYQPG
jgi:hypothetical protein